MDTLSLRPRQRSSLYPGTIAKDRDYRFLDLCVNAGSLVDLIRARGPDLVACVGWGPDDWQTLQVRRLLGEEPPDFPGGRSSLLVCSECGDLGCGAISAHVVQDGDAVRWHTFGYENTYDPEGPSLDKYRDIGPFRFQRSAYEATLRQSLPSCRPSPGV